MPIRFESPLRVDATSVPGAVTFVFDLIAEPTATTGTVDFEVLDQSNCVVFSNQNKKSVQQPVVVPASLTPFQIKERFGTRGNVPALVFQVRATVREGGVFQDDRTGVASVNKCECVQPGLASIAGPPLTPSARSKAAKKKPAKRATKKARPAPKKPAQKKAAKRTKKAGKRTTKKKHRVTKKKTGSTARRRRNT